MAESKQEKSKDSRIKAERNRLRKEYKEVDPSRRKVAEGLIDRAAYLRVELEELEADLGITGHTEMFSQGNQKPYERNRPKSQVYVALLEKYEKAIALLDNMLPKKEAAKDEVDIMSEFVKKRKN